MSKDVIVRFRCTDRQKAIIESLAKHDPNANNVSEYILTLIMKDYRQQRLNRNGRRTTMNNYEYEISTISKETIKNIKNEMLTCETFEDYCVGAGWQDWMEQFTEAEDGEPCSESELRTITGIQKAIWDSLMAE